MKTKKTLCLLTVIFLVGCSPNKVEEEYFNDLPKVALEHDYSEIKNYELSWEALFDPEDECYFVYCYSLTCNHCNELKNFMIEKALEKQNIYFVKGTNKVAFTDNVFTTLGSTNVNQMAILGFPSCIKIEDHVCKKNVAGVTQIKELLK